MNIMENGHMANQPTCTITACILDDRSMPPELLDQLRMRVEEVINGEHGRRLARHLDGLMPNGLKWEIRQRPQPKGLDVAQYDAKAHAANKKATQEFLAARKAARAQGAEYTAALRRLEARGVEGPNQAQVREEMHRADREAREAQHRAEAPSRATTTTDKAVEKILRRKEAEAA